MRVFYIFEMKPEFKALYYGNESALYRIFSQLYYLKRDDFDFGYHLFFQLTNRIEKERLDQILFVKMHQDIPYSKRDGKHRINNLYKDEVSILNIKHSYMLLTTNHSYSSFFNILLDYHDAFFVCDFKNQDYFFLNDIKVLV